MASIDRVMSESAGEDSEQLELTHNTGRGESKSVQALGKVFGRICENRP